MKWIELGQWFVRTSLDVLKITDDDRHKVTTPSHMILWVR